MITKISVIFLCLLQSLFAAEFYSIEKSDIQNGQLQYAISKTDNKWLLTKNSNSFDGSKSIGQFTISNFKKIKKEILELSRYYNIFVRIEAELGKVEVKNKNEFRHQEYFQLGKFKIKPSHSYYQSIAALFYGIKKKIQYKPIDAYKFNGLNKKADIFSDGSKVKSNSKNNCKVIKKLCTSPEFGVIFLDLINNSK